MIQPKILDLYDDLLKEYHTLMVGKIRRGSRGPETAKKLLFLDIQCENMKNDFLTAAKTLIAPSKKLDKKKPLKKNVDSQAQTHDNEMKH